VPHRYLVKDIAFQAGLSTATVDRVLNARTGVRGQTAARVESAIRELERQESNLARGGKVHIIDVVMEAPERFSNEVRAAFEHEAGAFHPSMFRMRFQSAERMDHASFAAHLDRIRLRGSGGVVVKAPDVTEVRAAVARLADAGIPVLTLVTDLPGSRRLAYAGMDNHAAGRTAAYLLNMALGLEGGCVLVTLSSSRFRGEEERVAGFRNALRQSGVRLSMVEISEGFGRDEQTGALALSALTAHPDICAVYSVGGANRSVLKAFAQASRACHAFVAHDLDSDNRALLADRRISFVLHHDLKADVRNVCRLLLESNGLQPRSAPSLLSQIGIFSPCNFQSAWAPDL
jgi:LacI family transcriptional regulator